MQRFDMLEAFRSNTKNRIDSEKTAILVIDVTRELLSAFYPREQGRQIVNDIRLFLNEGNLKPIYVDTVYSDHLIDSDAWDAAANKMTLDSDLVLGKKAAWGGEAGKPLYSMSEPKKLNSAFYMTSVEYFLKRQGVTTVAIVGIEKPSCAWDTALDAQRLGFNTYFIQDLTYTNPSLLKSPLNFDITPELAEKSGINLVSASEFLDLNRGNNIPAQGLMLEDHSHYNPFMSGQNLG